MSVRSATNEFHTAPEYHAGRLLAVCQHIQDLAAPDVGRTYTDAYFRAACQNPQAIVPRVVKVAQTRLHQIERRDQRRDIEDLLTRLHTNFKEDLPPTGTLRSQSQFQLGYFHQRADLPTTSGYGRKRYRTASGHVVKSFGEQLIADVLHKEGIDAEYEKPLIVPDATASGERQIHPDFTICDDEHTLFVEYCGLAGIGQYDRTWARKRASYKELGATPVEDLQAGEAAGKFSLLEMLPEDVRNAKTCRQVLVRAIKVATSLVPQTSAADDPF